MDGTDGRPSGARVIILSALSAFVAPLVFVAVVVLRKANSRLKRLLRHWTRRIEHEIARWS
jgi:hypothetical protein